MTGTMYAIFKKDWIWLLYTYFNVHCLLRCLKVCCLLECLYLVVAKWHLIIIVVCLAFLHSSQYLHSQDEKSNQYLLTFPLIQNDFPLQQIISCAHFTSWCYVENTMGHLNLCWDYDSKVESKTRYAFFLSLKCCTTKISCCIV